MKTILAIILVLLLAGPGSAAMIVSDPIDTVEYWIVTLNGTDYNVPQMGMKMLMLDLDPIPLGVHQLEIIGYTADDVTETASCQLVKEQRKTGTIYMLIIDEANANFFAEPTSLAVPNGGAEGGGGGGGCFIQIILGGPYDEGNCLHEHFGHRGDPRSRSADFGLER